VRGNVCLQTRPTGSQKQSPLMIYERAKYECAYCGQKFMTAEIKVYHEKVCDKNE